MYSVFCLHVCSQLNASPSIKGETKNIRCQRRFFSTFRWFCWHLRWHLLHVCPPLMEYPSLQKWVTLADKNRHFAQLNARACPLKGIHWHDFILGAQNLHLAARVLQQMPCISWRAQVGSRWAPLDRIGLSGGGKKKIPPLVRAPKPHKNHRPSKICEEQIDCCAITMLIDDTSNHERLALAWAS